MNSVFLAKKFISAFLLPIPIGMFLLFLGLFFLFINSYKKAKFFIFLSVVWFLLVSNQTVSNTLLKSLEHNHKALLKTPNVEYILVLGNGHKTNKNLSITSQVNPTAINRLVEGIKHYKKLKSKNINVKLIVSGYRGNDKNSHALMQEKLAISLGVSEKDILKLETPKDTRAEVIEVKKIVKNKKFILVTSSSHMKRSMLLFRKEGLKVIAAPTNYLSHDSKSFNSYFNASNIKKVELVFHEYLGIVWAILRGYI